MIQPVHFAPLTVAKDMGSCAQNGSHTRVVQFIILHELPFLAGRRARAWHETNTSGSIVSGRTTRRCGCLLLFIIWTRWSQHISSWKVVVWTSPRIWPIYDVVLKLKNSSAPVLKRLPDIFPVSCVLLARTVHRSGVANRLQN